MQTKRSGLAAAAARMQLTDAPEGKSSLQSRLSEAERRAQDAEASAQDARAALARTLLEAAQVEAVVTARIKAQSDAELEALRTELDTVKRVASTLETSLHDTAARDVQTHGKPPAADDTLEPQAEAAPDAPASASVIQLRESDRPFTLSVADETATESKILRFLPPIRLALLAFLAVGVIVGYLSAASFTGGKQPQQVALQDAASGTGLVRGDATDPQAIAEASVTLDAELSRLEMLSQKVAALRATSLERTPRAAPAAHASAETGWLLYMPVERGALVSYLAGGSWPGIQVAAQR